jgi:hypothetical protein
VQRLFGSDWNKIRLATVDKRVIVLLGSNTRLLDDAIANVQQGREGLQSDERFAAYRERAGTDTDFQLHLSLARIQSLIDPAAAAKPVGAPMTTSASLNITGNRVRLDLFAPYEEVGSVLRKIGW